MTCTLSKIPIWSCKTNSFDPSDFLGLIWATADPELELLLIRVVGYQHHCVSAYSVASAFSVPLPYYLLVSEWLCENARLQVFSPVQCFLQLCTIMYRTIRSDRPCHLTILFLDDWKLPTLNASHVATLHSSWDYLEIFRGELLARLIF